MCFPMRYTDLNECFVLQLINWSHNDFTDFGTAIPGYLSTSIYYTTLTLWQDIYLYNKTLPPLLGSNVYCCRAGLFVGRKDCPCKIPLGRLASVSSTPDSHWGRIVQFLYRHQSYSSNSAPMQTNSKSTSSPIKNVVYIMCCTVLYEIRIQFTEWHQPPNI